MKIAIVLPRGGRFCPQRPNSMETVVRTLRAASRYRSTTTVICDAGADGGHDGNVVTIPAGLGRSARNAAVAQALKTLAPDQIEHHQHLKDSADIAGRVGGSNHVFYRHTAMKAPRGPLEGLRYRSRLRRFQRLVFVSQAARADFLADYPAFEDKSSAVCNPVDARAWRGDVAVKQKSILFAGRPTADKGLDLLCAALPQVLDAHPDWSATLMLAEWERHETVAGPWVEPLRRFGDRVRIVPSATADQVREATRRAAIAVVPSRAPETLGLSAIEAHAAGAAVISSGRGGLKEASGSHALYIDVDQAGAVSDAITSLIENDVRRVGLARAGQAYAAATHTPARRAAELDALRRTVTPLAQATGKPIPAMDEGLAAAL